MLPSSAEIECFNKLKGCRLHFAWLRLMDGEHEAALRIAIDGAVSIFQRKFFDKPYMDEPVVLSTRLLLMNGGLSKERCVSSFELLAKRVFSGQGIEAENPGVVFRDLLSLKSMCPWSVTDISRVSFPLVFRMGRKGEMLGQANGNSSLNRCPVLSDRAGKIWTPIALADETDIDASCRDILLVCYSPIEQARKVAAKTHLGSMVHMTQSFRFVIERAFLPKEEL